jgi:hypothetical protein
VAIISERLWNRAYHRDAGVLGRTIRIDERPQTVVRVVPEGSDFGVLQVLAAADYSRGFVDRDPRCGRADSHGPTRPLAESPIMAGIWSVWQSTSLVVFSVTGSTLCRLLSCW